MSDKHVLTAGAMASARFVIQRSGESFNEMSIAQHFYDAGRASRDAEEASFMGGLVRCNKCKCTYSLSDCQDCPHCARDSFRAEVEKLREDAGRYRWLRSKTSAAHSIGHQFFVCSNWQDELAVVTRSVNLMQGSVAKHFDAAIDQASKA